MAYASIFELLAAIMKQEKIPCVLIGGFAVNYYHVTRQTADVDFLISQEDIPKVIKLLAKEGFRVDSRSDIFIRFTADKPYFMDLDFMFVEKETLTKIVDESNVASIGAHKFKVPSLLHLIALKLHAIKNNPKRQFKDLLDIVELVKANNIDVKTKEFRELCIKYGTMELYNKIAG